MSKLLKQLTVKFDPYTLKKIALLAAEEEISKGEWIRSACSYMITEIDRRLVYMDLSNDYIKMCEKAGEIQEQHKIIQNDSSPIFMNEVWLPRQDQLQEMVKREPWFETIYRFYEFLQGGTIDVHSWNGPCTKYKSMEQLWLAFVMKEKYGKSWTGEEWE